MATIEMGRRDGPVNAAPWGGSNHPGILRARRDHVDSGKWSPRSACRTAA
jgi:hypothetical protein